MATSTVVLEVVNSADLSPTEHLLLNHFIEGAVDPELAAHYLDSRIRQSQDVEANLRSFKLDWRRLVSKLTNFDPIPGYLADQLYRRDGSFCSLSRKVKADLGKARSESAYIIPPSFAQNVESDNPSLVEILQAFLSSPDATKLKALLANHDYGPSSLRNMWRLSPSMHKAFRGGHMNVRSWAYRLAELGYPPEECKPDDNPTTQCTYSMHTMYPEEPEDLLLGDGEPLDRSTWRFKFSTPDAAAMCLPDTFLFDVHRRFSTALHLFSIEDKISKGWPKPSRNWLTPFIRKAFYYLSRCVPLWIRMKFYLSLKPIGRRLYGCEISPWVHRLPFGLVIKDCSKSPENEPNALRLVEKYTSVPAPRLVDVGEHGGSTYIVMTHIPGQSLGEVGHLMSYAERDRFADDLAACVAQLRTIPNRTPYKFGDTLGGHVVDHRIPDNRGGPFNTEADFNNHLVSHLACNVYESVDGLPIRQDHRSFFTHSDFHSTNLLIEGGRLSGIIDWECAGYLPEYWEFTKAMWMSNWRPIQQSIFYRAFGHEYDDELAAERKLWRLTPFGV